MMMYVILVMLLFCCKRTVSENLEDSSDTNIIPDIIKVEADDVKNNSISFKIHTIGKVDTIFVRYWDVRSPSQNRLQWKFGGIGPYEVKNLMASSEYSFRFALSATGEWSRACTYTLLPDIPDVIVGGLLAGDLTVQWQLRTDDNSRKAIDMHELYYYLIEFRGRAWEKKDCAVTIEIPSCRDPSYTITSLNSGSYYEIRLRAHTASGYGEPYYFKVRA